MINLELEVNRTAVISFREPSGTTGLTDFTYLVLLDGIPQDITPVFSEVASGIYNVSFILSNTGLYTVLVGSQIIACITSVSRDKFSYLSNLEDEALGSWQWNKTTGQLVLLRQNGTILASFNASDKIDVASRERVS